MIDDIQNWITEQLEIDNIEEFETAFYKTFGFVDMPDGRKAQVKVILHLDERNQNDKTK